MPWINDITLDGRAAKLVLLPINWATPPKTTLGFDTEQAEGLSGIQSRTSKHHKIRVTQYEVTYTLATDMAEALRDALLALGSKRLVLPLWPEHKTAAGYAANRVFDCQHYVNYDPADGSYSLDADDSKPRSVGLMAGRLVSQPFVRALSDLVGTITVRIREDSPWASRVGIIAGTVYDWSLRPNWVTQPQDGSRVQLRLQQLGLGREQTETNDDAPAKRTQKATFAVTDRERIRRLLRFFEDKRGSWKAFPIPSWFRPGEAPEEVTYVPSRFAQDEIELAWITTDSVTTDLLFEEELELEEGEPDQNRPSIAHLYKFWWDGSVNAFTWTDWENDLTLGAVTYTPQKIEHNAPTENLKPGTSEWEIMLRDFVGNPLRAFTLLALERRLHLEIRECDPTDVDATARLRFAGEIETASCQGKIYTASASLLGGRLAKLVPNFYCQRTCNYVFGDDLCGIDLDALKVTTTISAIDGIEIDLASGGAEADDYFAGGYIEVGTGDDTELRFVLRSESLGTGVRLTLNRPLRVNGVSDALDLFPGCDGEYEGGCATFANQDEFGGSPHKPAYFESVDSGFKVSTGK